MELLQQSDLSMSFLCWNPNAIGLDILRVDYFRDGDLYWIPMKRHDCDSSRSYYYGFPYFNAEGNFPVDSNRIRFRVSFEEAMEKFKFRLMDCLRGRQLWAAASDRQFTEVEFVVAGESFQAIVAARCPLFQWVVREKYTRHGKYTRYSIAIPLYSSNCYFSFTPGVFKSQLTLSSYCSLSKSTESQLYRKYASWHWRGLSSPLMRKNRCQCICNCSNYECLFIH